MPNQAREVISASAPVNGASQESVSSPQKPPLDRESAVVKSGWLSKKGKRKIWSKRWFVLRETQLTYYKDEREYKVRGLIKTMDIEAVSMMKHKGREGRFAIFTSSHTYCLQAETVGEAQDWVHVIDATSKMATEELISGDPYRDINRPSVVYSYSPTSPSSSSDAGNHLFAQNTDRASIGGVLSDANYSSSSPTLPAIKPFHRPKAIFESSGDEWGFSSDSESAYAQGRSASPARKGPISAATASTGCIPASLHEELETSARSTNHHDEGPQPVPIRPKMGHNNEVLDVGFGGRRVNPVCDLSTPPSALGAANISFTPTEITHPNRIIMEGYLSRLHSHLGQKEWANRYVVLKPLEVEFYRSEREADKAKESTSSLVDKVLRPNSKNGIRVRTIPLGDVSGVVEIDPISKGKTHCMQIITPEKLIKFCAQSDEDLTNWLAAFQSALRRIKLSRKLEPSISAEVDDNP